MAKVVVWSCACLGLAVACTSHARSLDRRVADRSAGLTVRYPTGWTVDRRNPTAVTNPAFCFDLSGRVGDSPAIVVRVVEYQPPSLSTAELASLPARPRHFRLTMLRPSDSDWTSGQTLSFRDHGRAIYVAVTPARLPKQARATVEALLDSLRVGRQGRCRAAAFERRA